jgi:hypothetical protein
MRNLAKQQQQRSFFSSRAPNSGVILARRTIDVFIVEGRKIISNDVNKICSPFIKLKFGQNKKYKTEVRYKI